MARIPRALPRGRGAGWGCVVRRTPWPRPSTTAPTRSSPTHTRAASPASSRWSSGRGDQCPPSPFLSSIHLGTGWPLGERGLNSMHGLSFAVGIPQKPLNCLSVFSLPCCVSLLTRQEEGTVEEVPRLRTLVSRPVPCNPRPDMYNTRTKKKPTRQSQQFQQHYNGQNLVNPVPHNHFLSSGHLRSEVAFWLESRTST